MFCLLTTVTPDVLLSPHFASCCCCCYCTVLCWACAILFRVQLEVMGVAHRTLPLLAVQFHPESICTEFGAQLLRNFRDYTEASRVRAVTAAAAADVSPSQTRIAVAVTRDSVTATVPPELLCSSESAESSEEAECADSEPLPSLESLRASSVSPSSLPPSATSMFAESKLDWRMHAHSVPYVDSQRFTVFIAHPSPSCLSVCLSVCL